MWEEVRKEEEGQERKNKGEGGIRKRKEEGEEKGGRRVRRMGE